MATIEELERRVSALERVDYRLLQITIADIRDRQGE
jgi:hypothetical protein